MAKIIRNIVERCGPYILAFSITMIAAWKKINYIDSKNLDNALGGVLTTVSLIVGFIAAILPVVLGMRNDSKVVVYVFQKDNDKLFLKYIKSAIMTGLVAIVISIMMYFRDSYIGTVVYMYIFYVWIFFLLLFLGCTYRAVSRMLQLIFTNDDDLPMFTRKEETVEMKNYSVSMLQRLGSEAGLMNNLSQDVFIDGIEKGIAMTKVENAEKEKKWQAERDSLTAENSNLTVEIAKLKALLDKLQQTSV